MGVRIVIDSSSVWETFRRKTSAVESYEECKLLIADNDENRVSVFIEDSCDIPEILVTRDDEVLFNEVVINRDDCQKTVKRALEFLTMYYIDDDAGESGKYDWDLILGSEDSDKDDAINEREEELSASFTDFLCDITDGFIDEDDDEVIEDLKDRVLEYLARKYNIPIYRPMYLEDEEGVFFEQYPYNCMVFDEETEKVLDV